MLRYALTVFVSAFLLFQVQPLIGRFILPWFGGGPSIWTSCMLFFQAVLLGGYLYAHLLCAKLSLRSQALTHMCVVGASLLLLPISPNESWKPDTDQSPLTRILFLLLATVGAPYFVLASTGPLMQKWFSQTCPDRSPYRLYALSNIGSLLALISYPIGFEPWLTLYSQVMLWTALYVIFAVSAAWCAWQVLKHGKSVDNKPNFAIDEKRTYVPRPSVFRVLLWLSLAACGSAVLLATTNQLCIDVATVPFLWILPLSLYLISFIVCFDQPQWYNRSSFGMLLIVCVTLACWALSTGVDLDLVKQIVIYSAVLFACCMSCHGELVQSRPDPKYLTLFYLAISAGGVLGGIFVAIVATNFFTGYWEFPISIVACCVATLMSVSHQKAWAERPSPAFWTWVGGAIAMTIAAIALIWVPYRKIMSDVNEVGMFGGFGLFLFLGLVGIGMSANTKTTVWLWYGCALPSIIWTILWGMWRMPDVITTRLVSSWVGFSLLAFSVGVLVFWGIRYFRESTQRLWIRGLVVAYACIVLSLAYYQKIVSLKQLAVIILVIALGFVVDFLISRIPRIRGRTFGVWFWSPIVVLIGLLSYNLKKGIDSDLRGVIHQSRNFYGVLNVEYDQVTEPARYELTHGQIQHGCQYEDEYWKTQPTTYYGEESGLGLAIQTIRMREGSEGSIRVGIVGLGTGTIAAYGKEQDAFEFYEINPAVRDLSGRFFTYIQDTSATTEVKIGDARIVMERELKDGKPQHFDLLAIDAFSSDAIPVHLLTAECGEIYRQHISDGGILAIHISNRFLNLGPVVRGLADQLNWHAVQIDNEDDNSRGVFSSSWVLLTKDRELADQLEMSSNFQPWPDDSPVFLWTDNYSGLWRILSL